MFNAKLEALGQTWVEIDGALCGAKPDERGPTGGGKGYTGLLPRPSVRVATLDALLDALKTARRGDVVYVDGGAEIDCTERVHIENLVLEIPEGVTLASDRGQGRSQGGMILSDTFQTRPLIRAMGPDIRITGLRVRGPNPKRCLEHHRRSFAEGRGHEYYYKFPLSDGIATEYPGLEVDNCELGGWSCSAISLRAGDRHHIHHNHIHHNQYNGLGYGVSHSQSFSLVEHNLFNYNRHSIAGSGEPGSGYEARHNVEIRHSLSHCFDMHGGRDRKDNTDIAGDYLRVHHNTFRADRAAVVIRGVPEEEADISHNWFYQTPEETSVRSTGRTRIRNNAYGLQQPVLLAHAEPKP
ncbi:MAG: hypothetical protein EXS64_19210 [Candidatus Latescibacteria bacterium]|nr:hypothetical protein [Candidatus Latescibacterota bacterium]